MRRFVAALVAVIAALGLATAGAQDKKVRLSIGTGGTGGVYYPLGGGLAALITKYVPGVEATAEVRGPGPAPQKWMTVARSCFCCRLAAHSARVRESALPCGPKNAAVSSTTWLRTTQV